MVTFSELGIPLPLFEAPAEEAYGYVGPGVCQLCDAASPHTFSIHQPGLLFPCPHCGQENCRNAHVDKNLPCRSCGVNFIFPRTFKDRVSFCYSCLRSGRAPQGKDTEFGSVGWEYALQGITHGIPGLETDEFEMVITDPHPDPSDEWRGIRAPREDLFELLRTPDFLSWQDTVWLFCCRRPMTYLGIWVNVANTPHAEHLGDAYLNEVFESAGWGPLVEQHREGLLVQDPEVYTYHCKVCGRYRGTCDAS